jgi:hypothetical protein
MSFQITYCGPNGHRLPQYDMSAPNADAVRALTIPAEVTSLDARNGSPTEDLHWDRDSGWTEGRKAVEALLAARYGWAES